GFPASGGDSAPMVIERSRKLDALYQGYHITAPTTFAMDPGYSYYTSSVDGGVTWSAPVRVGAEAGTMSLDEWWIDGSIGRDPAGNLYAAWDTQSANGDVGWISFSTDGGATWSPAIHPPPDPLHGPPVI